MTEGIWIAIGVSVVIGAIIGGVTNAIAIAMLFRPYEPIYIGKWKVPFTPGLIPKRRTQMAEQLGRVVKEHLVRPEAIQARILSDDVRNAVSNAIDRKLHSFYDESHTLRELLQEVNLEEWGVRHLQEQVEKVIGEQFERFEEQTVEEVLGDEICSKIDSQVTVATEHLLQHIQNFVQSDDGKQVIDGILQRMITGSGVFGGMISMVVGSMDLTERIQNETVQFLQRDQIKVVTYSLLKKEWENIKSMKIKDILEYIGKDVILEQIQSVVFKWIPLQDWLDRPIQDVLQPYRTKIAVEITPFIIERARELLARKIPQFLEVIRIDKIVEDQVNSFPIQRLERIIIEIASRELKAITYLGAVLGGLIGLLQGLFYYFMF